MNRFVIIVAFFVIILAGCSRSTESFQGQIEEVGDNRFVVNCSTEVNKGKKGGINAIGYGCPVDYTNQTSFRDENGNSLTAKEIILLGGVSISKNKAEHWIVRFSPTNSMPELLWLHIDKKTGEIIKVITDS